MDGIRLARKAVFTVRVIEAGEFLKFFSMRGRIIGMRMIVVVRSMEVLRRRVSSITFTWSCTKMSGS